MSIRDHYLKKEYRSLKDNMVQTFYIPLLSEATVYKRAVGFFSSTSLIEVSKGITKMAGNGGKIQIVSSPYLSSEDIEAIKKGFEEKNRIIENALLSQIQEEPIDYFSMERLNLLANLIARGTLELKIAYTEDMNGIGMYHEKMGIIEDSSGDRIAFSGSPNASISGMSINYETTDVFRSWGDSSEAERVKLKNNAFESIWRNTEPGIKVLDFPKVSQALIEKYKKKAPNFNLDDEQFCGGETSELQGRENENCYEMPLGARIPEDIKLRDYQNKAIIEWVSENYRGIYDMATGTGKTFTGLASIAKLSEDVRDNLAVIIVCPYQHLVDQWVEDIVKFNIKPIIAYSNSPQRDWKKRLSRAVRNQKIRKDKSFFCLVCTNKTFASKDVQESIDKIRAPILLVVDEAHNFGARSYSTLLDDRFKYRLALSATLDRHRDEEGTSLLYDFFGKKCIEYTMEQAIAEDKLTKYKYHPIPVYLTEEELNRYEKISYQMSKCLIKGRNGKYKLNKHGEILAMARSRLVAGASQKIPALKEAIIPYANEYNILVYCGATKVFDETIDHYEPEESEIRQIEAVTKVLGLELDMDVAKFTSDENMETRTMIKEHFVSGNQLQAIVAIKCLDEGVNIPGIRTAFILASTTNPKEYIQRRGRVLRKAENKPFAEIYDFVTLPRELDTVSSLTEEQAKRDLSLVKNEMARIEEFGRLALNPMVANNLIWDIQEAYHIVNQDDNEKVGDKNGDD